MLTFLVLSVLIASAFSQGRHKPVRIVAEENDVVFEAPDRTLFVDDVDVLAQLKKLESLAETLEAEVCHPRGHPVSLPADVPDGRRRSCTECRSVRNTKDF